MGFNLVKKIREQLLISKTELARKAGVSPLTIDRVEKGENCRMETKGGLYQPLDINSLTGKRFFQGTKMCDKINSFSRLYAC